MTNEPQNPHPPLGYNPLLVFILIRVTARGDQSAKVCLRSPYNQRGQLGGGAKRSLQDMPGGVRRQHTQG